jgi:hypothetical protein
VRITAETTPDVTKQPEVMKAAADAGELLGQRLREGHDRSAITLKIQKVMMDKFQGSA